MPTLTSGSCRATLAAARHFKSYAARDLRTGNIIVGKYFGVIAPVGITRNNVTAYIIIREQAIGL